MLNFDSNHSHIKGNLNKKIGKLIVTIVIIFGLSLSAITLFSGCQKTADCDISDSHAHYYVNDDNFGRYIMSEKVSVSGLNRTEEYISVNKEDKELLEFLNKNGLFKISDNKEAIQNATLEHNDFTEYRYQYYYYINTVVPQKVGNHTYYNTIKTLFIGHSWSKDPNHSGLTGEVRECRYGYYGYKIVKNDNGKYEAVKSGYVDRIEDLPDGYDYIKADFYDIVNAKNKNEKFGYEDGPMEYKESIPIESYNQSENKTR